MKGFFLSLLAFFPVFGFSQIVDSAAVAREVDSLIQVSRALAEAGNFVEALEVNAQSEIIAFEKAGRQSVLYGLCCFNRGKVLYLKGNYSEAEKWCLEAKNCWDQSIGTKQSNYAKNLNNLANVYMAIGNYDKAKFFLLESKDIIEKTLGKESLDYYWILHNLACWYANINDFKSAEPLFIEAKEFVEKSLGKEHLDFAKSLNNLALLYLKIGNYNKAESNFIEANSIIEKLVGKDHPDFANSLHNIALFYKEIGEYDKSEPFFLEAKKTFEKKLGKEHPYYITSLNNLILLFLEMRKYDTAELLYVEANAINHNNLLIVSKYFTLKELFFYAQLFVQKTDEYYSFTQVKPYLNIEFAGGCYNNSLVYKGFLLTASNRITQLAHTTSLTNEQFNLLQSYHRRLAAEYANPIAGRKNVPELETKADSIEKVLVRTVAGFGEALRQVTWQEVLQQLKPGEAAVEFVHYRYYNPKPTDSTLYAALVLRPGDEAPQFVSLFEEREVASLVKSASGRAVGRINALYSVDGGGETVDGKKTLYDIIWKPLEPLLEGVKTVYCSPSGLLHRLNLGAIAVNESKTFADERQLSVLGSTRQLVLPDATTRSGMNALLIGGVRYTADTAAIAAANMGIAARDWSNTLPFHPDTLTRGDSWRYLPESAGEVLDIQNVLQSVNWTARLDTGYYATEETFRDIGQGKPSPRILHIATHGFFYPDPKEAPSNRRGFGEDAPVFKLSGHPMIRSGLLLAGADQVWSGGKAPENREDGILTAYEISQMNLSNTELVVLSACETGLGDIEGNEGVYGLQRAFKIAGAKYLVMSLWKVSDQTTRELMTDFYRQWLALGLEIPAAFRLAQQNMQAKYPDEPYHWAGFVLVE